jgi:transcription elongation factor GreA
VLDPSEVSADVVSVGTRVRLEDVDAGETIEYDIVGSAEADPTANKLSNESPVGQAIMGHRKGETVEVAAPRGSLKFKILDIQAA